MVKKKNKGKKEQPKIEVVKEICNDDFRVTCTEVCINFFDTVTTLSYPRIEVQELLEKKEACIVKCKEGGALYRLGVADIVGYVQITSPDCQEQMQYENTVYCLNVVACFQCLETFYYHFDERLVACVNSHKCGKPQSSIIYTKGNRAELEKSFSLSNESDIQFVSPLKLPCVLNKITDVESEMQLCDYNLYMNLKRYYMMKIFTDMTVVCDGEFIECHRLVLCSYSVYFEEVVDQKISNGRSLVHIQDLQFWQVKTLIDFMYTGKLEVEESKYNLLNDAVDVLKFRKYLIPIKLICYRLITQN